MMDSITPRPWRLSEDSLPGNDGSLPIRGNYNDDGDFVVVARVQLQADAARGQAYTFGHGDDPERDANARLIAASPDLLRVCRELFKLAAAADHSATKGTTVTLTGAFLRRLHGTLLKAGTSNWGTE